MLTPHKHVRGVEVNSYVVVYRTPKDEVFLVESTKHGLSFASAVKEAERSSKQFKPLTYHVREKLP